MIAAIYLLKVMLCSGILLLYYWLVLRNKAFHQWNRFYLLSITALSLLLPLIKIPVGDKGAQVVQYISVATIDNYIVIATRQKPLLAFSTEQYILAIYLLVSTFFLLLILQAAKRISDVLKSYPRQKLEQIYFLNTDASGTPFSFLNYMVWNRDIDLQSQTGKQIFSHELAHIKQKHTLDKIFLLIIIIPFWVNPFFWLIRKELNAIHEFIADEKALQNGTADDLSRMVLNALYPKQAYLLTSPFFQSSIKRRLHMFTIKNQKINYMSRILILPIVFMVAAAFTVQQKAQKEKETFLEQPFVIDDTTPVQISGSINGIVPDKKDKLVLRADSAFFEVPQLLSSYKQSSGLLIVNNKKTDIQSLQGKIIVSKETIIYPANHTEAIQLYGPNAKEGVVVLQNAQILDKKESAIYKSERDTIPKKGKKFDPPIIIKPEVQPLFDGNWATFLQKNLNPEVPVNNGAPAGQYTVIAQFIVEMDGNITDLKAITKHGYGMEEEVLKLMRQSPKWIPAKENGRKVRAYRKQPITFVISEDGEQVSAATDKLYIGIDNPIKLDFGNLNLKDFTVSISQGSIHHKGAYYVARVNTIGPATIKVSLNDNGKIKELGSRTFIVDVIQDEKVYFEKIEQQIKRFKE